MFVVKRMSFFRLSGLFMQNKCLYIISSFWGKKETPTQVFSCGICETFKNSGGCFWKHVTYYYVIKNYVVHKLAIFNVTLLLLLSLILHLLLTRWWDMRLEHVAWLWEERADSRNSAWNKKAYCSCYFILIRIDTILSANI